MIIRPCTAGDIAAIGAIYREAVLHGRASFEIEPPSDGEMTRRMTSLVERGFPYLVGETDDRIDGYAYAGPYRERPAYRGTVENSVYVAPSRHGQGFGRELLDALVLAASVRGFRQMIAVIGDSANHPSIRLHEACGFTHVGTLRAVGWKHEMWLDTVLMQRALDAGADIDPGPPS